MVTFGIDISHHQDIGLDLAQCRREGIEFVFLKATEGASYVDPEFTANLDEARRAGMLVAAYHYVRSNASTANQVMNVVRTVPKDVPVILDVEANSGGVGPVREIFAALRASGYSVPLLYLPRWYWQQIGSPSLAGLPPLWSSRYPDTVVGTLQSEWASVPASYWAGYGGLDVAVLQFTSSARIAGHQPLDANAFRGTREQLAALLGGGEEKDIMLSDVESQDLAWRGWAIANGVATYPKQQGIPERLWGQPAAPAIAEILAAVRAQADDEAKIIAAVKDIVTADANTELQVSPEQLQELADAVVAAVPPAARQGADEALRAAFARAAAEPADSGQ